jgi:CheY-like chemotaxis protein
MNTFEMLEELGDTALQAASAPEALDIMRRVPGIDLVITDQAMPQMTGMQFAEIVESNWPETPVILATGYGELPPDANRKILKLATPFYEEDLTRTIQNALQAARKPDFTL